MRRSRYSLVLPALLAVIALSAGLAPSTHAGNKSKTKDKTAPQFSVKSLNGKTIRLSDFKGKTVILDFWATWCGPCRASMPHLSSMQKRYGKKGLVVLGLSVDELAPSTVKRFSKRLEVDFRLAMANEKVLYDYGPIRSIPTTFFIGRDGKVVRRVVGYVDEETMEDYVLEALAVKAKPKRTAR